MRFWYLIGSTIPWREDNRVVVYPCQYHAIVVHAVALPFLWNRSGGFILDVFLEIVFEILLEIYAELMMLIVPEKCSPTNRIRRAKIFVVCILILLLILLIWKIALFSDPQNRIWGIAPISIFILFPAIQIIAGIILYRRRKNLPPKSS